MSEKNKYFNASDQSDKIAQQSDYVHKLIENKKQIKNDIKKEKEKLNTITKTKDSINKEIEQLKDNIEQTYDKYYYTKQELGLPRSICIEYTKRIIKEFYAVASPCYPFKFDNMRLHSGYKKYIVESKESKDRENAKLLQELDKNIRTNLVKANSSEMEIKILNKFIEDIKNITIKDMSDLIIYLEESVEKLKKQKSILRKVSEAYTNLHLTLSYLPIKNQRLDDMLNNIREIENNISDMNKRYDEKSKEYEEEQMILKSMKRLWSNS